MLKRIGAGKDKSFATYDSRIVRVYQKQESIPLKIRGGIINGCEAKKYKWTVDEAAGFAGEMGGRKLWFPLIPFLSLND